jgi:MerR family copper efflux transcriptional regulator
MDDQELDQLARRHGIRPGLRENVGEAAARLGTTPRMLRYAEQLGLVAPERSRGNYRVYRERDLLAAAYGGALAVRYKATPAALAFALRPLAEPDVAGRLRTLARLAGRRDPAARRGGEPDRPVAPDFQAGRVRHDGDLERSAALDFETSKARRLLRLAS